MPASGLTDRQKRRLTRPFCLTPATTQTVAASPPDQKKAEKFCCRQPSLSALPDSAACCTGDLSECLRRLVQTALRCGRRLPGARNPDFELTAAPERPFLANYGRCCEIPVEIGGMAVVYRVRRPLLPPGQSPDPSVARAAEPVIAISLEVVRKISRPLAAAGLAKTSPPSELWPSFLNWRPAATAVTIPCSSAA